jgi:regulation of enolase protein 1 (concanavalin A-like superfamily)
MAQRSAVRRTRIAAATALTTFVTVSGLVAILSSSGAADAATIATLYAAPAGSGTACTSAAPCSLDEAQTQVESLAGGMTGDIDVQLAGGTYRRTSTWTFTGADSASNGHQILWQAESGQTPVITGGAQPTGWTRTDATKNIWTAQLPTGVVTRDLWIDGQRVPLASDGGLPTGTQQTATGYTVPGTALQGLSDPGDLQFEFYPGNWVHDVCGVASISGSSSSTTITMDEPCYDIAKSSGYINLQLPRTVENNPAFLSGPDQWAFDSATGQIWVIPPTGVDPTTADVEAGSVATLLALNGTEAAPVTGLDFSGITFTDTTWPAVDSGYGYPEIQADVMFPDASCATEFSPASFIGDSGGSSHDGQPFGACNVTMPAAVEVHAGRQVQLDGDTFTRLGTAGITYDGGTQGSQITGNQLTDVGGNGIQIGSVSAPNQSDAALVDDHDTVNDNHIDAAADEYHGGVGIWSGYAAHLTIAHNDIENLDYSGISTGWGWGSEDTLPTIDTGLQVSDNFVSDTNHTRSDGGALYSLGPQPGGVMSGNYLADPGNTSTFAMYLDQGSSGWALSDNVADNFSIPTFNNRNTWDPCNTMTITDTYISGGLMNGGSCVTTTGTVTDLTDTGALRIENNAGLEPAYADLAGVSAPFKTYATGNSQFGQDTGSYTVDADGAGVGASSDQYGAVYVPSAFGAAGTATVRVADLDHTAAGAQAGLMVRDSLPGSGSSLGYAALALTSTGVSLRWDADSSGSLDHSVDVTTSGAPEWLRLTRSGTQITGAYSSNGTTWTTVGTETLSGAQASEDVGMYAASGQAGTLGHAVFDGFSTTGPHLRAFASTQASIVQSTNPNTTQNPAPYVIDAAGAGPWKSCCQLSDEYGALYEPGAAGSQSTLTAQVVSETDTNDWAMAGLMIRNDITGAPGSTGYAALAVTPGHGVALLTDSDGSGYLDQVQTSAAPITAPVWLRLTRNGTTVTGAYSEDESTWTTVGTATLTGANATEDAGMFGTSFDSGVSGHAAFADFSVTSAPFQAFASTTASIFQAGDGFEIDAAGAGPWKSCCQVTDQYAALYQPATAGTANTTIVRVDSQTDTNEWAMAGLMIRNDLTGSPGSLGYAALALTPGHGVSMFWDGDSSGYLDNVQSSAPVTGPVWLRLVRNGTSLTGSYSTDGQSWTTVDTITLTGAHATEDVGAYASAFQSGQTTDATFSDFSTGS